MPGETGSPWSVRERRAQRSHPNHPKPEVVGRAPNEAWSWDVTRLLGPKKGVPVRALRRRRARRLGRDCPVRCAKVVPGPAPGMAAVVRPLRRRRLRADPGGWRRPPAAADGAGASGAGALSYRAWASGQSVVILSRKTPILHRRFDATRHPPTPGDPPRVHERRAPSHA